MTEPRTTRQPSAWKLIRFALAINQATNKIYVANYGSNNISVIDGATNYTTTVTDPNVFQPQPTAVAVNPATGQIYVANYNTGNLSVITEEQLQSIPVTTAITPLANNLATSVAPIFSFSSTNNVDLHERPLLPGRQLAGRVDVRYQSGIGRVQRQHADTATGVHTIYAHDRRTGIDFDNISAAAARSSAI